MGLKSYGWDVRNIAKMSLSTPFMVLWYGWNVRKPEIGQKTAIFYFFYFRKNCPYDSNEILYSPSTPYYGHLCVISSNSFCCDWSESEGKRPKPTPLPHLRLWFLMKSLNFD